MIGNTSSQHKEPDDVDLDFYVKQNKNKKGGENKMDNNQQNSTVVQPSANPSTGFSASEPDPKGEIASQKYDVPVFQKAIDEIETILKSFEEIAKSEYPNVSRASSVSVNDETNPNHSAPASIITKKTCTCPNCTVEDCMGMAKADTPDTGRASSVNVANETEPDGKEPSPIVKAIQKAKDALDAVKEELVGKDKYANQDHSYEAGKETTEVTKAAQCCDNACGKCKGPGCGCCSDCKKVEKAAESSEKEEEADDKEIKKSVWGGAFTPINAYN